MTSLAICLKRCSTSSRARLVSGRGRGSVLPRALISIFDEHRLSKSPAVFDTNKLAHLNNTYIKNADPDRIADLAIPHLQSQPLAVRAYGRARGVGTRARGALSGALTAASDIVDLSEVFFRTHLELDAEGIEVMGGEQVPVVLSAFLAKIEQTDEFNAPKIAALIKEVQKETGFKGKQLFMPIRVALTGQTHGRDLNQTIWSLGRDRVLDRLRSQIKGA